jgi:hypothetical protein
MKNATELHAIHSLPGCTFSRIPKGKQLERCTPSDIDWGIKSKGFDWRCADMERMARYLAARPPDLSSISSAARDLRAMVLHQDPKSAMQRRAHREPSAIKQIHMHLRAATTEAQRL